ncbi:MAG: hypothetical protein H0U63_01740 [Burkholderiales bacterium]|nr:hypothetical protein [Burkholderiales bacterium]
MSKIRFVVAMIGLLAVAGCGGGGGGGNGGGGGGGSDGNSSSSEANSFIAAVQRVIASSPDDTEPEATDGINAVETDSSEPVSTS